MSFCSLGILFVFILLTLLVCDNIELNPRLRKRDTCYNLSICHWNLNSITAHNFEKVNLLEAYNTVNKFDRICLSETYLDFSILSDNDNLVIKGYHPDDIKRGGVCAYIRESLARCLFNSYLKECLILEVCINNKKGYVISLYRSPSQATDEFDLFMLNLESLLADISNRHPHFVRITRDSNVKSRNWSTYDSTTSEGAHLDYLMTLYGLNQLITEPTHIL